MSISATCLCTAQLQAGTRSLFLISRVIKLTVQYKRLSRHHTCLFNKSLVSYFNLMQHIHIHLTLFVIPEK